MKLFGINEICLLLCCLHCFITFMDDLMTITSMLRSVCVAVGFFVFNTLNCFHALLHYTLAFVWIKFL